MNRTHTTFENTTARFDVCVVLFRAICHCNTQRPVT
jgi:hypothetical protein